MNWVIHPARSQPGNAGLAIGVIALVAIMVISSDGLFFGIFAAFFLAAAIAPFLLPTSYVLDDDGVELRRFGVVRRRSWGDLRRWVSGSQYLLLSPFSRPHMLDRTRGMLLDMRTAPDGARALIEGHLGQSATR